MADIGRIGQAILAGLQQGATAWQQQRQWKLDEPYRQAMIDKLQAEYQWLNERNKIAAKLFEDRMPGVEIHANLIDTVISAIMYYSSKKNATNNIPKLLYTPA